ncbi:MAG: hypothetical protein ACK56I_21165, partial [bacterium]
FNWMITVEQDLLGEKFFHLKPFVRDEGHWFFSDKKEAEQFLKSLNVSTYSHESVSYLKD